VYLVSGIYDLAKRSHLPEANNPASKDLAVADYLKTQDEFKNLIDKVVDKGISTAAKTEIEKIRKAPM